MFNPAQKGTMPPTPTLLVIRDPPNRIRDPKKEPPVGDAGVRRVGNTLLLQVRNHLRVRLGLSARKPGNTLSMLSLAWRVFIVSFSGCLSLY